MVSPAAAEGIDGPGYEYYRHLEERQERTRPLLENGTDPHNSQWFAREWFATQWLDQYDRDLDVIDGFYKADILREQVVVNGVPVLVVGPNFYRLSGFDKRRVTHVVDVVYTITEAQGTNAKFFRLQDWKTGKMIGLYNADGLTIQ